MKVVYKPELHAYQIVYTERKCIFRDLWNKPVNNKLYKTWDEAQHVLDKLA